MSWMRVGKIDLCICKECRWCRDAVVEMIESLCGRPYQLNEFITSPLWYCREAAKRYLEEEAAIKRGEDPWNRK